jgi:RNA polymerase sigma factor (sigma-70 family)
MDEHDLISIASQVISWIKPNKGDSESVQDCWQTAYVAGLQALRTTQKNGHRPSRRYLCLCMQQAVYRSLCKSKRLKLSTEEAARDDAIDTTELIEAVDAEEFIAKHLSALSEKQARTLLAHYAGETTNAIAAREGIGRTAVHERIKTALTKLRSIRGVV